MKTAFTVFFISCLVATSYAKNATTITDFASAAGLKILSAAIEAADLTEALSDKDLVATVFAPTDAAFVALLKELNATAEDLLTDELLVDILLYHVVDGAIKAADVPTKPVSVPTFLDGFNVTAVRNGTKVLINDAVVVKPDVAYQKLIIHVIDKVLIPELEDEEAPAPEKVGRKLLL